MSDSKNKSLSSPESYLVDYIRRLERHRIGVAAVHVKISKLLRINRREHYVRTAVSSFDELVPVTNGRVFTMTNNDIVFIFPISGCDEVDSAIFKLKFLFTDDPLINGELDEAFNDFYDIEKQFQDFLNLARRMVQENKEVRKVSGAAARHDDDPAQKREGAPLTPRELSRVDEALRRADLSNMMRRQAICAIIGDAQPQQVFNELFISIKDLQQTLMPNFNVTSNRWLFQHLTEILDKRMLSLLSKTDDSSVSGSVSINLNVSTLLSPDFLAFDDNVKAGQRGTIVLELQKMDIFADLSAYFFARDFCRERGYRICVDGISHHTLSFMDRAKLGVDMVKLIWLASMAELDENSLEELKAAVKTCGETRVILCRCDDERAVQWGHANGITMFQGRHVEHLLTEYARAKNSGTGRRPGGAW